MARVAALPHSGCCKKYTLGLYQSNLHRFFRKWLLVIMRIGKLRMHSMSALVHKLQRRHMILFSDTNRHAHFTFASDEMICMLAGAHTLRP